MSRAPSETSLCDALYKPSLLAHLLTNLTRLRFAARGTVADPTQGYFRRPSVSRSLTAAGLSVLILFFAAISSTFCNADRNAFAEEGVKHSAVRPADLLTFQDASGQTQPVKTAADWEQRRQQILNRMQLAMGKLPDLKQRPAVTYRVLAREETPEFQRLDIRYTSGDGDEVPALLFLPAKSKSSQTGSASRAPGVLALHPTGPLGKKIAAGEGPRANRPYGLELARRGYVVLAPDYPSFGDYTYDFENDAYESGTMKGIVNHMRGVDLLQSLEEVDREQIGTIGHSLGGHNALFLAVYDPRVKAAVTSCGWTLFSHYYGGKLKGWTSSRYMPRIDTVYHLDPAQMPFEFDELIAAIAPRAVLSVSPVKDDNFDLTGIKLAAPRIESVYHLIQADSNWKLLIPDCNHDFPDQARQAAYEWLDQHLRTKIKK